MKNAFFRHGSLPFCALALSALLLAGCATCKPGKPGPIGKYDVEITLDPSLRQGSVVADLVAVNVSNLPDWLNYPLDQYWKEDNAWRKGANRLQMDFRPGNPATQTLSVKDAKWKEWRARGVTHLLVLADLPVAVGDATGGADPRRKALPLDICHWADGTKKLSVLLKPALVEVQTPTRFAR